MVYNFLRNISLTSDIVLYRDSSSVILPTIEPEIDQFEKRQAVAQCDAQAVYKNREIVDIEVRQDIRILKVLHYRHRYDVSPPVDIRVYATRPHSDKT